MSVQPDHRPKSVKEFAVSIVVRFIVFVPTAHLLLRVLEWNFFFSILLAVLASEAGSRFALRLMRSKASQGDA